MTDFPQAFGRVRERRPMTDPLRWETLDSAIDYSCPGFDVRRDDVRLPDGTETDYHYLTEPEAVVILPFTDDGEVVVTDEWRQAVGRIDHGLPVGGLEPEDESVEAGARRELREETGYEAAEVERFLTAEPANGIADSVHHYFVARGCTPSADQELDFNESIRPTTTTFEALRGAVGVGEIRDGRTVTAVLHYDAFGGR